MSLYILPEILVTTFAVIVLTMDLFIKEKRLLAYTSLAGLILATLASFFIFNARGQLFNGLFVFDPFAVFFKLIFLAVAILVVIASIDYVKMKEGQGEYYSLLLFATLGMMIVASAGDLVTLYLGLELASISTYVLTGLRKDAIGSEAAGKYYVIGALSSAIIVFGISLLYGITGTTNIAALAGADLLAYPVIALVGAIFLIAGFGFKMAAVPFHMWAPDAYQGAPTTVTAFLAAGAKKMGFAAAFKVFAVATIALKADMSIAFALIAVVTMTLGNVVALLQKDIKRMLAYSSVGHVGYILIGLAVFTPLGYAGGLFHVLTHAFMKAGAFIAVALVSVALLSDRIDDYKGLGKRAPITAFALLIFLLSLIGIPPLAGFWSKVVILLAAVQAGGYFILLAVALVINSVISLFYYGRVIKYMYITRHTETARIKEPIPYAVAMIIAVAALVLMGLFPQTIVEFAMKAAGTLI
jgi:NADH-quinone oxidoreductase subunit N